jgi:cytochrome c oxidase assembly factor CtaG/putative copper export protein
VTSPLRTGAERLLPAVLPIAAGLALLTVSVAAASSGAFAPPGFGDPGALVRWAAPAATALGHLAAALTTGALLLVVAVLPARDGGPATRGALVLAGSAAAAWAVLSAVQIVLDYATVVGEPPTSPSFGAQLGLFVTQVSLGRLLLAVTLLAALASTLALAVTGPRGAAVTLVVVVVALAVLAETGHAAGTVDHDLATTAMTLHLVGVTAWVGGLAALVLLARRIGRHLPTATARFSTLALWAFLAVVLSGAVSAWLRLGGVAGIATPYGRLVLVKLGLLLLLGVAGWAHRRRILPALAVAGGGPGHPAGRRAGRSSGEGGLVHRVDRVDGVDGRDRISGAFWRLAAVELAVMGATTGVAVALAGTPPPVPDNPPAAPTPTESVTGYPAPPEPGPVTWWTQWRLDLLLALAVVVMVVVYLRWVLRLRRRGDAWPVGRTVSWVGGAVVLAWVTNGPPTVYGQVLFSAHMLLHMVLAMVTPVLFCLAAPVTLALRALPARRDGSLGPREWVLAVVDSRWGRFVAHPLVAAAGFGGSMVVFYLTPLFPLALSSHAGHVAMVVHFSLVGYLFANVLVGVDPGPRRPAYPVRLLLLFATVAFHAFFGVALAESSVLLAADWYGALGLPWGVDALADQQQGAYLAWAIGEAPTLALAAAVAMRWVRDDERTARREDRAAARDGDAELAAYNAMLADLAARRSPSEVTAGPATREPGPRRSR